VETPDIDWLAWKAGVNFSAQPMMLQIPEEDARTPTQLRMVR
jgi:hypothetical protein